jgi:exosortase E/protease (VPEID-CTERM system)
MFTRAIGKVGGGGLVGLRTLAWLALGITEMLIISLLFDFTPGGAPHHNPVYYVTRAARWLAIAIPMLILMTWSERQALVATWAALEKRGLLGRALLFNLVIFAITAAACSAFTAHAATSPTPPWRLLAVLGALVTATAVSLLSIIIPLRGLATAVWTWRRQVLIAGGASLVVVLLADAALQLWEVMAEATLLLAAAILGLYETNVLVDHVERGIRVGEFGVLIWDSCSGLEGLALVAGFVTVYLWTFRSELSFPRALLLYPIGLAASWLLNGVRIAALVSIGAHVSPDMAVKGFHSQAGWIAFLMVALSLMLLSRRLGILAVQPPARAAKPHVIAPSGRYGTTVSHLLPFVALMIGSIAMSVAAPHDRPVYVLKAVLVATALWICWRTYEKWNAALPAMSVSAGLLVGIAWIATSPTEETGHDLGRWLSEIGPWLAAGWLIVRGIGTIVLVPIAEELAFRGFLYRRLISRDFHLVGLTAFSWVALVVSSLLFGALHERWLAGALAGAIFALIMLRSGRLGDAILAHATANALIFAWALAFRQWSLL